MKSWVCIEEGGRKESLLCDDECESISHVLWEFPVCSVLRNGLNVQVTGACRGWI